MKKIWNLFKRLLETRKVTLRFINYETIITMRTHKKDAIYMVGDRLELEIGIFLIKERTILVKNNSIIQIDYSIKSEIPF